MCQTLLLPLAVCPAHHSSLIAHHSTRVVVAGISQYQSAMDYLERALLRYYPEPASIEHEPAFAKIRTKARFKRIMQHYFSEKSP